jgi:hypothetical protein
VRKNEAWKSGLEMRKDYGDGRPSYARDAFKLGFSRMPFHDGDVFLDLEFGVYVFR